MFDYFKNSIARKIARRFFKKYPYQVDTFQLKDEGKVEFANWKNPLLQPKAVTQEEVNFFKKFIKKGDFCIDIGGNIGDTTVPMALAAGKEGISLAFDPNPYLFEVLSANANLNKDKTNIIALEYAITDEDGEFYYSSSEASFGNGGITKDEKLSKKHGKFSLNRKIKGINLENYLNKNHADDIKNLSFIKIDAEGYDIVILNSIENLIDTYRPVLVVECFTELTESERINLLDFFLKKDYRSFYFENFNENSESVELTPKHMMNWVNFNFYAYYSSK